MLSEKQFLKLTDSIEWSQRQMTYPRTKYREAIRMSATSHYAEGGPDEHVPVDFIKLAELIYIRLLAPQSPRAMFSTHNRQLRPTAMDLSLAVNQIPKEIGFDSTLQLAVLEALYGMGIVKVGLHTVTEVLGFPYGKPYVDLVTLDDYFWDMSAKRRDLIQYEGNDYWLPFEELMESDWVEKKHRPHLAHDEFTLVSDLGEDKAKSIGTDGGGAILFKDKILLRDVWLPDERVMATYAVTAKRLLKQVEADDTAPEKGPYHKLGFIDMAGGNIMPLPPVALWRDIHELANTLYRKMARQAVAQKSVSAFGKGAQDDEIEQYRNAQDGAGIRYTGQRPEILTVPGVDQVTLGFWLQNRDVGSWIAGNLDSLGGLSAQTDTVGQEKMLTESANAMLRSMSAKTIDFVRGIYASLARYEWDDPMSERTLEKPIIGTDKTIPVKWNQDSKVGEFSEYELDIDIYSGQDQSPSLKLQKLGAIVQGYIMPLMPSLQQQGATINVKQIMKLVAKYSDFEELEDIVQFMDDPPPAGAAGGPGKPANTTRTYDRVSRPGASASGKSQILQQALFGGNPQGSEAASLTRSSM